MNIKGGGGGFVWQADSVFEEKGFIIVLSFKSIDFASTTFLSASELTNVTSLPFSIRLIWIQTAL